MYFFLTIFFKGGDILSTVQSADRFPFVIKYNTGNSNKQIHKNLRKFITYTLENKNKENDAGNNKGLYSEEKNR